MRDFPWFPPVAAPPPAKPRFRPLALILGLTVAVLFWFKGHRYLASLVGAVSLLGSFSYLRPSLDEKLQRALSRLQTVVSRVATWLVLLPFYWVVFGAARLALLIRGRDLLGLRWQPDQPTYWQPAPPERKRSRYYGRLFTQDRPAAQSNQGRWIVAASCLILLLAVAGEVVLRRMGFGAPILYRRHPRIGYYIMPHQDIYRYGGRVHINDFGMRSPDCTPAKPPRTLRILLIGDSTLYGGSYIDQSEMYASRLRQQLNQEREALRGSPEAVEVLVVGVNGWGPQHELAYVEEFGFFQSDLVIVTGPPEDAYRPRYDIQALPYFEEGKSPGLAWLELTGHLLSGGRGSCSSLIRVLPGIRGCATRRCGMGPRPG